MNKPSPATHQLGNLGEVIQNSVSVFGQEDKSHLRDVEKVSHRESEAGKANIRKSGNAGLVGKLTPADSPRG